MRFEAPIGCGECYGEDPRAAWEFYHRGLTRYATLVDDSHFMVNLRRCSRCGQSYVWVFMESVDWTGGEDPQYRRIVPITPDEVADLAGQGEHVDTGQLGALGRGRRHLATDWPSDAPEATIYWTATGFLAEPGP